MLHCVIILWHRWLYSYTQDCKVWLTLVSVSLAFRERRRTLAETFRHFAFICKIGVQLRVVWIEAWKIAATQLENSLPVTHRASMSSCILSIRFLLCLLGKTTNNRTAPAAATASSRMTTITLLTTPATSPPLCPCCDESLSPGEMPGVYNIARIIEVNFNFNLKTPEL